MAATKLRGSKLGRVQTWLPVLIGIKARAQKPKQ